MQQLTRRLTLVAKRGHNRIECLQADSPRPARKAADRSNAAAHHDRDPAYRHARASQLLYTLGQLGVNAASGAIRTGSTVFQSVLAALLKPPHPLARCRRRLIPAASAAAISPMTATRSISNLRPSKVNLAFLWLFTWLISS